MPVLYPATLERYVTVKGKTCRKWIYKTLLFYVIVSCFNQVVTAQEQKKADLLNQENEFQNQQQKELEEKIKARPGMRDLLILQQNQYKEENAQENLKSVIRAAELAEQNRIAAKKLE